MHILDTVTSLDSRGASPIIAQFMAHERVLSEWIQTQYFTGGKCRHLPGTKYFRPQLKADVNNYIKLSWRCDLRHSPSHISLWRKQACSWDQPSACCSSWKWNLAYYVLRAQNMLYARPFSKCKCMMIRSFGTSYLLCRNDPRPRRKFTIETIYITLHRT